MKCFIILMLATLASCDFDYDADEAYRFQLFSSAAYCVGREQTPLEFLNAELPGQVLSLRATSQPCQFESECSAIVAHLANGSVVVAFRGTNAPMQLIDEMSNTARPRKTSDIGGLVLTFFQDAHENLWPDMFHFVKDYIGNTTDKDVYVTGHSLGGALASLFAAKLVNSSFVPGERVKVITFGEPRVGNYEYATNYDALVPQTWRVVHYRDVIPHTPWCSLLPWRECSNNGSYNYYYHHGTEVFYGAEEMSKDSEYKICRGFPVDEDNTCSNYVFYNEPCYDIVSCVYDHLYYFGNAVGKMGIGK